MLALYLYNFCVSTFVVVAIIFYETIDPRISFTIASSFSHCCVIGFDSPSQSSILLIRSSFSIDLSNFPFSLGKLLPTSNILNGSAISLKLLHTFNEILKVNSLIIVQSISSMRAQFILRKPLNFYFQSNKQSVFLFLDDTMWWCKHNRTIHFFFASTNAVDVSN